MSPIEKHTRASGKRWRTSNGTHLRVCEIESHDWYARAARVTGNTARIKLPPAAFA
jgi:hypothetical protein